MMRPEFLDRLEAIAYDTRLVLSMPKGVDKRIVIVDIDEKSLAEIGRWPWGRDRIAQLVDTLFEHYRVAIVGFDVVFAEHDESSGLKTLERLSAGRLKDNAAFKATVNDLREQLDFDALFARSLRSRPVILGYYFNLGGQTQEHTGVLPRPSIASAGPLAPDRLYQATSFGANLRELNAAAAGAGHFTVAPDIDGVVRRAPLLIGYQNELYEALSVAMVRTLRGNAPLSLSTSQLAPTALHIGDINVPLGSEATVLIPYRGHAGSFRYISAADILAQRADPALLQNAIILVGTTAPGLFDLRSTPVGNAYPGVEAHANLIAGMLDQTIRREPAWGGSFEFFSLLVVGVALTVLLSRLDAKYSLAATLGTATLVLGVNLFAWRAGIVLPIASVLLLVLVLFTLNMAYGYLVEGRSKRHLEKAFGLYVAPELVGEMGADRNLERYLNMEGENRVLTVLFCDIRDFTKISEGLPPQELKQLMNAYLTPMTKAIFEHRGTIDKYIGDAIMAFWGAPKEDAMHATRALEAALAMQQVAAQLRSEFAAKGWPPIHIGIGINTGAMNVGNMGSSYRLAYTVLGDTVNTAARLEALTRLYDVPLIVGEATRQAAPDFFYRELDRIRPKGRDQAITIYEPMGKNGEVDKDTMQQAELFQEALKLYRARDWDMAELQLINLNQAAPCGLYRLYLQRIAYNRANPPGDDWYGVHTLEHK